MVGRGLRIGGVVGEVYGKKELIVVCFAVYWKEESGPQILPSLAFFLYGGPVGGGSM